MRNPVRLNNRPGFFMPVKIETMVVELAVLIFHVIVELVKIVMTEIKKRKQKKMQGNEIFNGNYGDTFFGRYDH